MGWGKRIRKKARKLLGRGKSGGGGGDAPAPYTPTLKERARSQAAGAAIVNYKEQYYE